MKTYSSTIESVVIHRNERNPRKWSIYHKYGGALLPEFMPFDHDTLKDARFYVVSIMESNHPVLRFANGSDLIGVKL